MAAFLPMIAAAGASFLSNKFGGGSQGKTGSTYTKQQRNSISDVLDSIKAMRGGATDITQNPAYGQGMDWLSSLFNDENFFNSFEAPIQRQFQEQTVPELANRFAGMGSGGALGSTAFRNQLAREGSNLHTNIAALRGQMQQQGVNQGLQYAQQPFSNLMALYQQALQPTQNTYQPPSAGLFGNIAGGLSSGFAQGYGNQMGQNMASSSGFDLNQFLPIIGNV